MTLLDSIREEHGDVPIQQVMTLLAVALNEGESQQAIQKITKQGKASTSRNIQAWSTMTRHHTAGPGYVEAREDMYERRRKLCYLTQAGAKYLKGLLT